MSYRSRRSARRYARKSRTNFIVTLGITIFLLYATIQWILPTLISGIGFVTNIVKPSHKNVSQSSGNASLAPPVLNISFEATNSAQINIRGYGVPNSKIELFLDDQKKDTVHVSEDGSFEFKDIELTIGTNNIFGKSLDDKDQESLPSKTFVIIYDNEKPPLEILEPEDNKKIQGGDRKVKISGQTETGAKIFVNDAQVIVDGEGKFSTEKSLNDGDNDFNIKSVDLAGNFTEISRRVNYSP